MSSQTFGPYLRFRNCFRLLVLAALTFLQYGCGVVIYVSSNAAGNGDGSDWENAYTSISEALSAAKNGAHWGDEIWVASGTYNETITMKQEVHVYGGFAGKEKRRNERDWILNETIVDATGLGVPTVIGVYNSGLDGFTITGGKQAGIQSIDCSSHHIINCLITNNAGSGVYCFQAHPKLTNCIITGNKAEMGGGIYCKDSDCYLTNCTISGNTAMELGGGIYYENSGAPQLTNCTISGNQAEQGGGLYCKSQSSPSLTACSIAENSAARGGGLYCERISSPSLTNCVIAKNSADAGSAVYAHSQSSIPLLVNCAVIENSSSSIYCELNSGVTLSNSIVWNLGEEFSGPGVVSATYSCLEEGWPGEGNISDPPNFSNELKANYRLQSDSPCIDAGDPNTNSNDQIRPPGLGADRCDMGAYGGPKNGEWPPLSHRRVYVNKNAPPGGSGSSWETARRSIVSALTVSWADEIWVAAGAYIDEIELTPGVEIYGGFVGNEEKREERNWAANQTTIGHVYTRYNDTVLDGFTISGVPSGSRNGVTVQGELILSNCRIEGWQGGVRCEDNADLTMTNCALVGNTTEMGAGVNSDNSVLTMTNCTIAGNKALGSGVYCTETDLTVVNCILWNPGSEIIYDATSTVDIRYSCIQGGWTGEGNISRYPDFIDPQSGDYHLKNGAPCIDAGHISSAPKLDIEMRNRLGADGCVDMGAYESPDEYAPAPKSKPPQRFYVRANAPSDGDGLSWDSAFNSIAAAVLSMEATGEIWVAGGKYRDCVAMEPGVDLYAGFFGGEEVREQRNWTKNETIIESKTNIPYAVLGADRAVLDGFTVTGYASNRIFCCMSSPTIVNCTISGISLVSGSGVHCENNSAPSFFNCAIAHNQLIEGQGGGVFCSNSSPRFWDCTFTDNRAEIGGGMHFENSSSATIVNCTLSNNQVRSSDEGGGLSCYDSSLVLKNCTIEDNSAFSGGGLYVSNNSSLQAFHCSINKNIGSRGGGASIENASMFLVNCLFSQNNASLGEGLYCENNAVAKSINCTMIGTLNEKHYIIYGKDASSISIMNGILWNDLRPILASSNSRTDVRYSCIQEGFPGEGNISDDPLFVDFENADLRLLEGSPCIDAGNPDASYNDARRPPGLGTERCDMGAFGGSENQGWISNDSESPVGVWRWLEY